MKNYLITAILALIAGVMLYHFLFRTENRKYAQTKLIRDTIYRIEQREPIILSKVEPKIHYLRDTIYHSPAFIAILDTIVRTDTVYVSYEFPENLFDLTIKHQQDTNMAVEIVFRQEDEPKEQVSDNPFIMLALFLLGLLVGNLVK